MLFAAVPTDRIPVRMLVMAVALRSRIVVKALVEAVPIERSPDLTLIEVTIAVRRSAARAGT
jgi:hypothetical protein